MQRLLSSTRFIPAAHTQSIYHLHRRTITTATAKSMLGFTEHCQFTVRELRHAYFEAAKLHHPDVVKQQLGTPTYDFRDITNAYEHLLNSSHITSTPQNEPIITHDEEEEYRRACLDVLGIPAEIVEESKKNPMFRQWLMGKTDAAMVRIWNEVSGLVWRLFKIYI